MIYVCADIHGRKDKFDRLLGKTSLQRDDTLFVHCITFFQGFQTAVLAVACL